MGYFKRAEFLAQDGVLDLHELQGARKGKPSSVRQDIVKIFRARIHTRHRPLLGGVTTIAVLAALLVALSASAQTGEEVLADLRVRAAQGDADAQFNLGVMYDNGEGAPQYTAGFWRQDLTQRGESC